MRNSKLESINLHSTIHAIFSQILIMRDKMKNINLLCVLVIIILISFNVQALSDRIFKDEYYECRIAHNNGRLVVPLRRVTLGIGGYYSDTYECLTGSYGTSTGNEYPKGSGLRYLGRTSYWYTGLIGNDTLATLGIGTETGESEPLLYASILNDDSSSESPTSTYPESSFPRISYAFSDITGSPTWWNASYKYVKQVTIDADSALGTNYTVQLDFTTSTLVSASKMRSDARDLHGRYP